MRAGLFFRLDELFQEKELLTDVIDNVTTKEREVQDKDGRRYVLRVRPYKTPENRIEGAVMIFLDLDKTKTSSE